MSENNEVSQAIKTMAELMALMYYHVTKSVIQDFGEDAKESIRKGIRNFGYERGENIARKVKEAGEELTIENLDLFYDMPLKSGWTPDVHYDAGSRFDRTKSCTFANVWIQKNWMDVGLIYCDVDAAIREGYSKNISYEHTKTMLSGDDFCASVTRYRDSECSK